MDRRHRILSTLVITVCSLLLVSASCQGEDPAADEPGAAQQAADQQAGQAPEQAPVTGGDLTAVRCPMVPTDDQTTGAAQWQPAEDAFDTGELIGLELAAARERAADNGCDIVVSLEDGVGLPVPLDINPTLIYVYTEDEVVTAIEGVGGGL